MTVKTGRKPIEITAADLKKIETLASRGLLDKEIFSIMGWSHDFFYKKKKLMAEFNEAIERGRSNGHAQVANKLFEACMAGSVSAMQYYLARRAGWIEPKVQTDPDGDAPAVQVTFAVAEAKGDIKITKGKANA
jgi:hypothetical protein